MADRLSDLIGDLPPIDFIDAEEMVMKFRTRFDGKSNERSAANVVVIPDTPENVRTKQAFKDEVNINNIIARYKLTGNLPDSARAALAKFGDFSNVPDYQSALNTVMVAQEVFSNMPSALRNRFDNDPGEMLAFLNDSRNRDEAIKLGMIDPPSSPEAVSPPIGGEEPPPAKGKGSKTPGKPDPSRGE